MAENRPPPVSVRLRPDLLAELDRRAQQQGLSRSAVITVAVTRHLRHGTTGSSP